MSKMHARMEVQQGDITGCEVDAIVNAANQSLLGGGGVDGAIHRVAGPQLMAKCRTLGGCPTGQAKITSGYKLKARHVIHTVGPVYKNGRSGEPELLANCYRAALELAREHGCRSVAFPAISCGVYRYPLKEAAGIAIDTVQDYFNKHDLPEKVVFVLFNQKAYDAYIELLSDGTTQSTGAEAQQDGSQ